MGSNDPLAAAIGKLCTDQATYDEFVAILKEPDAKKRRDLAEIMANNLGLGPAETQRFQDLAEDPQLVGLTSWDDSIKAAMKATGLSRKAGGVTC